MSEEMIYPKSPREEVGGIPYFVRMCDKIRKFAAGELHEDYHANLGKGFDLWTCQFLGIDYQDLVDVVTSGKSDEEALEWAFAQAGKPQPPQLDWWLSYMRNRGYKDELSERLEERKVEAGFGGRDDIACFFDFIDAEEGRELV